MIIERLKYTQQRENGVVVAEWIGVEVKMDGTSESEVVVFDKVKEIVDNLHKRANPDPSQRAPLPIIQTERPEMIDELFVVVRRDIESAEYQEDAVAILNNNGFTFNAELKKIANNKPKRPVNV